MNEFSLANVIVAILATGSVCFIMVWLFAAPVEKSKARGLGMMIGSIGYYFFGNRDSDSGGSGGGEA